MAFHNKGYRDGFALRPLGIIDKWTEAQKHAYRIGYRAGKRERAEQDAGMVRE